LSEKGQLVFLKYKHLIFAIVIIIIVIVSDIIFEKYTKKSIETININIEKIYNTFEKDSKEYDKEELEEFAKQAMDEWEKRADMLACFIEHEEVEKINAKLHLLDIELKNFLWGEAKRSTTEIRQMIDYLEGKYKLSIQNIF